MAVSGAVLGPASRARDVRQVRQVWRVSHRSPGILAKSVCAFGPNTENGGDASGV